MTFFSRPENKKTLEDFQSRIEDLNPHYVFQRARDKHIQTVIRFMIDNPDQWDELCEASISQVGKRFIKYISYPSEELSKPILDMIFALCFRFLQEFDLFSTDPPPDQLQSLQSLKAFARSHTDEFDDSAKSEIDSVTVGLPLRILRFLVNSEAISSLKKFNELSETADKRCEDWESNLSVWATRVESLRAALENLEKGYNFVGLFDGFRNLAEEKGKERKQLVMLLFVFGLITVTPVIIEIIYIYSNIDKLEAITIPLGLSIIPIISLVIIFTYYFRVILQSYQGVKAQILQIELRKTLCQFIQSYAEYSKEIRDKDSTSLDKFENIIFSGIVSDDERAPSTFDGMDQLGKLIKAVKS